MKFFMPVYAVALTLAVTSNMFEQTTAAQCTATEACPTGATCVDVADATGKSTVAAAPATLVCPTGKIAYISSLKISPNLETLEATKYGLYYTVDSTDAPTTFTDSGNSANLVTKATGSVCDNTYTDVGKTATKAVKAVVACSTEATACDLKYSATWACQAADSCAKTCTDTTKCTTVKVPNATPLSLTKPSTLTCTTGKFAYISSIQVGVTGDATTSSEVTVSFTNGASTALTVTKDPVACDSLWADVGKTAATADIQAKISCSDTTTACDVIYQATWVCQAADATPAPTSGVAGVCPVAAWGTALVAAVAGANFAAPL